MRPAFQRLKSVDVFCGTSNARKPLGAAVNRFSQPLAVPILRPSPMA